MFTRRALIGSAGLISVVARAHPGARFVTPEDMGWRSDTSPSDTAGILNDALAKAAHDGIIYFDNAPRRIGGTVKIGAKTILEFGTKHRWQANLSDMRQFTPIKSYTESERSQEKRVFVDVAGARGTIIRGPMTLRGLVPKSMAWAQRASIPADLVAISASDVGPSSEMTFETLSIEGFGHAFYQASQFKADKLIMPYIRWNADLAIIRFCLQPIVTGGWGNGMDDAMFRVLRLSRNGGASIVRGTDLNAASFFNFGLDFRKDVEPDPISLRKGDPTVRLALPIGTFVAASGGRRIAGQDAPFVAMITRRSGDLAILDQKPDTDFQGEYVVNPPSLVLHNSGLNGLHLYLEGIHADAIRLENGGKVSTRDLKISAGHFASRSGYAIDGEGRVDLNRNPRTVSNRWLKGIIPERGIAVEQ